MKNKILLSLLVIFAMVLSTGLVYAVSPFGRADSSVSEFLGADESNLQSRFVLEDSYGTTYDLNIALGCVLYGVDSYGWPNYGFIFGDEMVLWMDGPGGEWQESLVYTGMWNFETRVFDGFFVNYPSGSSGSVQMWPVGAKPGDGIENGQNPRIAQSNAASNPEDSGASPMGTASGESVKTKQNTPIPFAFDTPADRGSICYEDSYGHIWDLDIAYGCIYYGSMGSWPAYGFIFGDEMVLWADGPGTGGYVDSFAYTGMWDFGTMMFDGTWVNTAGVSGTVELWPCGASETEYYAVIAGEGYTCAYADNDAYDMYKVLTSYSNWDVSNIKLLVSTADGSKHDCTKTNIQNEIAWMASQADEDDVCVFFYAGHGGFQLDDDGDEDDPYDEYICPEGGNILDDELDTWMSAISGYKLVALDSCYSGGFIKEDGLVSRCLSGKPEVQNTDGFARDLDKPGFNVHTACDEDELAWGSGALQNGVFTYYFVEGLYGPADSEPDGDVDSKEAHSYTYPKVLSWETPQLYLGTEDPLIWVE